MTLTADSVPLAEDHAARRARNGLIVGILCPTLWGFLPLLFALLAKAGALTIVADRAVWSLVFVAAIVLITRRLPEVRAVLADRRTLRGLFLSTALLVANWLLYVYTIASGHPLEGSLGYFINPLVNVVFGVLLLRERMSRWQAAAILIAVVAIGVQAFGIGHIPFLALGIAISFGLYSFVRKTVRVESTTGLFVETILMVPFALAYLAYTFVRDGGPGLHADPYYLGLLILTGPATAVPLLMFAFSVRRIRLATTGMLQFISPSIQFLLAIFVLREPINTTQLISFALIWVALVVYSADAFRQRSRPAVPA